MSSFVYAIAKALDGVGFKPSLGTSHPREPVCVLASLLQIQLPAKVPRENE